MSSATSVDTPAPGRRFDLVAYLKLFRFPLVFTAIADSATGYLLGSNRFNASAMAWLALASAGLYCFGMSLNDIADLEKDKSGAPGKVLPSGRISPSAAKIACAIPLAVSLGALLMAEGSERVARLIFWGAAVFFIGAYDLFLKIPPAMGLVRASNLLMGLFVSQDLDIVRSHLHSVIACAVPTFVYITALTYVSTQEDGAPNRARILTGAGFMVFAAGLAAFVFPLSESLRFRDTLNPVEHWGYTSSNMIWWRPVPFTAPLSCWILYRAWKAVDRKGVMLLVRDGIGGIIFLDAALSCVFGTGDYAIPWLIASLVLPAIISVAIFKKLA